MTREEQGYKLPEKPIDYSPQAIAERAVKEVEPYFENALKEHNMTREEQDNLWNELSEKSKKRTRERYSQPWMTKTGKMEYEQLFGKHNLNPLTFEDVVKELFKNGAWQVAGREYPSEFVFNEGVNEHYFLNCASEEQGQKLLAINKLLNVAKFLNKDWQPDWGDEYEEKFYIYIKEVEDKVGIARNSFMCSSAIYFRSEEIAQQAVQILGKDVVRKALTSKY